MTGVRSTVDISRLSKAVSRPGIDPRVWLVLATVDDVGYDENQGVFADVLLAPDGDKETCLVGSDYAGNDFGVFFPPKKGDIVLVGIPMGDPGLGPVIIKRLFSGSAKPPSEFHSESSSDITEPTTNPTIRVEDGKTFRWVLKNGANLKLEIEGDGKVEIAAKGNATVEITGESAVILKSPDIRLGLEPGQATARLGDLIAISLPPMMVAGVQAGASAVPVIPLAGIPAPSPLAGVGQIISGAGGVKT